jgi:uncharacterized repeat protein (TIGR03803 family)
MKEPNMIHPSALPLIRKRLRPAGLLFTIAVMVIAFCSATSPSEDIFTNLDSFDYTNGAIPFGMVQALNGDLYGVTNKGGNGANNGCNISCGSIFQLTSAGVLTSVVGFDGTNGNGPSGILQATNGAFYGTTGYGGAHDCVSFGSSGGCGTIFKLVGTTLTTVHNFCAQTNCADGAIPLGGLVQGTDGNFYGTTVAGGDADCSNPVGPGCGTVFKITPGGVFTVLHRFVSTDGAFPYSQLIQATNGDFYGTTSEGGRYGYGTIFKITSTGAMTTLHNFNGTNGSYPYAGLVQAANGDFYGVTSEFQLADGAPNCGGTGNGYGTFYRLTSTNAVTTLFTFDDTDGAFPYEALTLGNDGNFYGATACGGTSSKGVAFKLTPGGAPTILHDFAGSDGAIPYAGVTQYTNGKLFGTAVFGGADNDGTVFSIEAGLAAFVMTRPSSGAAGSTVYILGNNMKDASAVTFNGTAASFKVISGTELEATVPSGATSGTVEVTTPTEMLKSNVAFAIP